MPISTFYRLHSMQINVDDLVGPVIIGAMDNLALTSEMEIQKDFVADTPFPPATRSKLRSINCDFVTRSCELALSNIPATGLCIKVTAPQTGVTYFFAEHDCGPLPAGANHIAMTMLKGVLYIDRVTANDDDDATVTIRAMGVWDGNNSPIVKETGITLPTVDHAVSKRRWGMYLSNFNGQQLDHMRTMEMDFGCTVTTEGADNDPNHSIAKVDSVAPILTVGGVAPQWLRDSDGTPAGLGIPIEGQKVTQATTEMWLKENDVAIGTAAHIKMAIEGMAFFSTPAQGNARELATSEIRVEGNTTDAGGPPLVVTTGSAIS